MMITTWRILRIPCSLAVPAECRSPGSSLDTSKIPTSSAAARPTRPMRLNVTRRNAGANYAAILRTGGDVEEHDAGMGRAPRPVLVLGGAAAAGPVLSPDPFHMLDRERHEGEDPEDDSGLRHVPTVAQERAT